MLFLAQRPIAAARAYLARPLATGTLLLLLTALALAPALACGSDDAPTPTTAPPTATQPPAPVPEATRAPAATATPTATAVPPTVAQQLAADLPTWPAPDVPNRGYNAIGSENAPIVMYDYSDFA